LATIPASFAIIDNRHCYQICDFGSVTKTMKKASASGQLARSPMRRNNGQPLMGGRR
jgi:hypothetical protein